jgi:hypothetical protein
MVPIKTVLITDLNNTLFDWVELWFKCFSCMLVFCHEHLNP